MARILRAPRGPNRSAWGNAPGRDDIGNTSPEGAKHKASLRCFALSGLIFFGIRYPGRRYTASPLRFALG